MEIYSIDEIEKYSKETKNAINNALLRAGSLIVTEAVKDLHKHFKNTDKNGDYNDSIDDGFFYALPRDGKLTVSAFGSHRSGSGTFRTKFLVAGAKNRKVKGGYRKSKSGVKYVAYKKPLDVGEIEGSDSLVTGLNVSKNRVNQIISDELDKIK